MSLPQAIRVRISSEAAGAISLTPVVVREMRVSELVEMMLAVYGKDTVRIAGCLERGAFVSGASRLRWEGWEPNAAALAALLQSFPDDDPQRPFDPTRCLRAIFRSASQHVEVERAVALRRRLFQRRTFWDALMQLIASGPLEYLCYDYRQRSDRYRCQLSPAAIAGLLENARLRYQALEEQLRRLRVDAVDLDVER